MSHFLLNRFLNKRQQSNSSTPFFRSIAFHLRTQRDDLKHGDRLVIITDEDYKYDEETIKIFQKECEKEGFELFLSNISFETWLLMHYEKVLTPHEQQELEDRLEKHLGKPYIKSEGIPLEKTMILQAIDHANLVLPEGDNTVCFKTNPSTRVHMLVEELIKGDE